MNKLLKDYNLIGISGKQYAGKDVLADLLVQALPDFRKVPIAGAIKTLFAKQHNLSLESIEQNKAQYRPELIKLGDWGRAQDPDYWLKQVLAEPGQKIVSDVRLPREYHLLREHGAFLIRMEASRDIRAERGHIVSESDPTETALDNIKDWDVIIHNNGNIADLRQQVQQLLAGQE